MRKVVKFGGSSLANAAQFKKVGEIIRADQTRRYVVPSAPGKRHINDTKVTDMLYHCYELAEKGKKFLPLLNEIKARYEEIIDGLHLELSLDKEFEVIAEQFLKKAGRDYAASRGEYLNGIVMSSYLGITFIDAAEVIFFDKQGNLDLTRTEDVLAKRLENANRAVIPGFYGMGADGKIQHIFKRRIRYCRIDRGKGKLRRRICMKAGRTSRISDCRSKDYPQSLQPIEDNHIQKGLKLSYMGPDPARGCSIFPVEKTEIPIQYHQYPCTNHGTMITWKVPCRQSSIRSPGLQEKVCFSSY